MTDRSPSPPVSRRESYYNAQRASSASRNSQTEAGSPPSRRRTGGTAVSQARAFGYSVPVEYANLNESVALPPVENMDETALARHRSLEDEIEERERSEPRVPSWQPDRDNRRRPSFGRSRTRSSRRGSRPMNAANNYSFPEAYENLNEFPGPGPIENPDERGLYRHNTLEEERHRSQQRRQSRRLSEAALRRPSYLSGRGPEPSRLPSLYQQHENNLEAQLRAAQAEAQASLDTAPGLGERVSRFATQLYTISYLIFFSILGTLARLGIEWLGFYPGAPVVTSVVWANFAGSLFMGFLAEDQQLFREEWGSEHGNDTSFSSFEKGGRNTSSISRSIEHEEALQNHAKAKKTIPLYIGLATGFCGSLTSFSTFMRDVFLALSNNLTTPLNHPYPANVLNPNSSSVVSRNGGYSLLALLGVILTTVCLSLSALKIGAHIAIALDPLTPTVPFVFLRKLLDRLIVPIAFGSWLGAVLLSIWPPDRPGGPSGHHTASWASEAWRGKALFACVFAPLGCLVRFYASLHLNGVSAAFPLGTFAVNVFGTAVEAMAFDLQHVPIGGGGSVGAGLVSCQLLQGIMDGFCGCVTTVSTWVAELNGLRRAHSYVYGLASVATGLVMTVAIMGSVRWSVGWSDPVCKVVTS